jgi:signal transduction histidine kinase
VRRDVAEVLHGHVQSRLLAAQLRLEMAAGLVPLAPERALAEIKAAADVLEDVRANDVRAASHQLHPPAIRVGLLVALRSLIARVEGEFGLEVELEVGPGVAALDDPTAAVLDEGMRLVMYRALDAALHNAFHHGDATHAVVELRLLDGPRLQLVVTDDGHGLDDAPTMGLGLGGVAARVEHRRGTWALSHASGGGARLTVTVPFRGDDMRGGLPAPGPRRGRRNADVALPLPSPQAAP